MDPFEEFLSPEALRLLLDSDDFATTADQSLVFTSDQSLSLTTPPTSAVDIPSPAEGKLIRKRSASSANIPGCSTLVLDNAGSTKPKRAKFSAEARAKVASVRKKGACMRCHRNKIPCSGEWPCESCCRSRDVIAGRASRHRWMDCVPFSMKDLDIFATEMVRKDHLIDELLDTTLGFYNFDLADIWVGECMFLKMKSKPSLGRSNIGSWRTFFGLERASAIPWIVRSKFPTSNQFDCRLNKSFQLLATWLIGRLDTKNESFTQVKHGIDYAQSVAGSKLLQCLEKTLSNISLSKLGAETLRALSKILLFTMSVVTWFKPRSHSSLEFHGRQEQLLRVLAHHMFCVKERLLSCFGSIDKEVFITNLISHGSIASGHTIGLRKRDLASGREIFTPLKIKSEFRPSPSDFMNTNHSHFSRPKSQGGADHSFNQHSMAAVNTFRGPANRRDQHLEESSKTIPPALDQRKRDINHPTLYMNADTVFERKSDCGIIQRHANARSPYVVDPQPEDRHWTFGDHNEIDSATSTTTAAPLPGLQSNTFCSWCGCLQTSYKPSQGVVSCDGCFTPYQSNDLAAACWGLENHRSTEPSFDPPSGLSDFQGDLVNRALTPEVTSMGTDGNDPNDFSWFMSS